MRAWFLAFGESSSVKIKGSLGDKASRRSVLTKNLGSLGESDAEKGGLNGPRLHMRRLQMEVPPPGVNDRVSWSNARGSMLVKGKWTISFKK